MPIKTLFQAIRTALFYCVFIGQTAIIAIIIGIVAVFAGRTQFSWNLARYWCWSNVRLLRVITGLGTSVSGAENIPDGGCIIASKHQSDWDVFAIFPYTGRPAFIVKKELMRIPFFGAAARSLDCIEIDRSRGSQAIPGMLTEAREALQRGCRIVIYPEGTRKAPLADADYRQGIVRMYTQLNVPVVPVALNSGLFWGRNSGVIWPGMAQAQFLPPIEPGLPPEEFAERLKAAIEPRSQDLIINAIDRGIARPITGRLAERLATHRRDAGGA